MSIFEHRRTYGIVTDGAIDRELSRKIKGKGGMVPVPWETARQWRTKEELNHFILIARPLLRCYPMATLEKAVNRGLFGWDKVRVFVPEGHGRLKTMDEFMACVAARRLRGERVRV